MLLTRTSLREKIVSNHVYATFLNAGYMRILRAITSEPATSLYWRLTPLFPEAVGQKVLHFQARLGLPRSFVPSEAAV